MGFNLVQYRRVYTEPGYKTLSETDLEVFSDGDTTVSGISFSGENVLLICDLGARYDLDGVVYYRQAATTETTVFYGRQGEGAEYPWALLSYTEDGQEVAVDLRESENKYRFIKVVHSVSEGTAVAFELEVITSVEEIMFGTVEGVSKLAVDSGTSNATTEEIPIYNPDSVLHEFFCLLDSQGVDSSGLLLGTSSGTLFGLHETGLSVPDDFPFASGSFNNTVVSSGTIVLQSGTSGFYYTPIIDIDSFEGPRLFFEATVTGTNKIDESGNIDNVPTIGVRLSDSAPVNGGWVSGQLSTDSNWDVVSGTLSFNPMENGRILEPWHPRYFQARAEFSGPGGGESPILLAAGVEEGHKLTISGGGSQSVFIKSTYGDHFMGREAALFVWYLESRNEIT